MIKKIVLLATLLLVLLVSIPSIFSIYQEILYSGEIKDDTKINISGKEFMFSINSEGSKVSVSIEGEGYIINNNECRIKNNINVCIDNLAYSHKNFTTFLDVYKAQVDVYQIKSEIDIEVATGKENLLIGEVVTSSFSLENLGDIAAENVVASISLPSNLELVSLEGCKKILNKLVITGNVNGKQIKTCSFDSKALYEGDFVLQANVSYFNGGKSVQESSSKILGKVYPYAINFSKNTQKTKFDIGEKFNMTIVVENTNSEYEIDVKTFNLEIPRGIKIIKKSKDMKNTNGRLSWNGFILPEENKTFDFELQSFTSGEYGLSVESNYKIDSFLRNSKKELDIEIKCDCLEILKEIPKNIEPENPKYVKIGLFNPNQANSFKNIQVKYTSDIPGLKESSKTYDSLNTGKLLSILSTEIKPLTLDSVYQIDLTLDYQSEFGEFFSLEENIVIKAGNGTEKENNTPDLSLVEQKPDEKQEIVLPSTHNPVEETVQDLDTALEESEEILPLNTNKQQIGWMYYLIGIILVFVLVFVGIKKFGKKPESSSGDLNLEEIEKALKEIKK
ncbi:hypothetical protein ISS07_02375 [Candidatus Woesearchaeota archaeon]|nr:hypothetical protein [Candidatus Woesearchaeota archaeon]